MSRWEVHLALWDALVIDAGGWGADTAWTCTSSMTTDAKKKKN